MYKFWTVHNEMKYTNVIEFYDWLLQRENNHYNEFKNNVSFFLDRWRRSQNEH